MRRAAFPKVVTLLCVVTACGRNDDGEAGDSTASDPAGPDVCDCSAGDEGCPAECTAGDPIVSPPSPPPPSLPPLPPPEVSLVEGRRVVTLETEEFEVGPGEETFRCQNFANPFGDDVAIVKSHSVMPQGSHHMFVFVGGQAASRLSTCGGLQFGPSVHSAQRADEESTYPEGVGRLLSGTQGLRIQAHYLNTTEEPILARVSVRLETVPVESVTSLASHVFINTLGIGVAPHSTGSAEKTCATPAPAKIIGAASHMHQYGVHFEAYTSDGRLVYETDEWAEPEPRRFSPPLEMAAGDSITIRCEYDNTSPYSLGFGESAARNEMCILSGVYYPAPRGSEFECVF